MPKRPLFIVLPARRTTPAQPVLREPAFAAFLSGQLHSTGAIVGNRSSGLSIQTFGPIHPAQVHRD